MISYLLGFSRTLVCLALAANFALASATAQGASASEPAPSDATKKGSVPAAVGNTGGAGSTGSAGAGGSSGGSAAQNAKSEISIGENNTLRLGDAGTRTFLLRLTFTLKEEAEDRKLEILSKAALEDLGELDGAARTPPESSAGNGKAKLEYLAAAVNAPPYHWRVQFELKGLLPGTTQVRLFRFTVGEWSRIFEVTVTNKPLTATSWTPRQLDQKWTFHWGQPASQRIYPVEIDNTAGPEAVLKFEAESLADSSGYNFGLHRFHFVPADGTKETTSLVVPANSTITAHLGVTGSDWGPHGSFSGNLQLKLGEKKQNLPLTIRASSAKAKWFGVGVTALGLAIFCWAQLFARSRQTRLEALLPCLHLSDATKRFIASLNAWPQLTGIKAAADILLTELSDEKLDEEGLLPSKSIVPIGTFEPNKLKTYLDARAARLEGLVELRNGVAEAVRRVGTAHAAAAIVALDNEAHQQPTPQTARTKVAQELGKLTAAPAGFVSPAAPTPQTAAEAMYQLNQLSLLSIVLWAIISIAGAAVWIVTDVDFGTPMDYLGCLLGGLGVSSIGATIQSLDFRQVATRLNVKLPA